MFEYRDTLEVLNKALPLHQKLVCTHKAISEHYGYIDRISAALYDPDTDTVKTFIHSSVDLNPLSNYSTSLSQAPSLKRIIEKGQPRVVKNMQIFADGEREHTKKIKQQNYASSYTLPMFIDNSFFGFLFFNSFQTAPFDKSSLHYLDAIGHLLSLVISHDLIQMKNILASVKTAKHIMQHRDDETATHLVRMAHFSQLIATEIAEKHQLTDEFIEKLFLFAPLHDLGKIGTPDEILLKPGKLSRDEFEIMKQHTTIGRDIIDNMLENFNFQSNSSLTILRNIAELHHESINGKGYPYGLKAGEIPIEARIISVADVFDALTSKRPYKEAWSNEEAFKVLKSLAGIKLDENCVQALINNEEKVMEIQEKFLQMEF